MACTARRERMRIAWSPTWDEYKGYTANYLRQQQWRCDPILDLNDLMQDAYLTFSKVKAHYPRVIEARHFMALYKRALANTLHDKANYRRKREAVEEVLPADVTDFCVGRIGEVSNAGYLMALIAELPEELRMVLDRLAQGVPQEPPRRGRRLTPREGLSMQLRRLLRLPMNSDPLAIIKRKLWQ